MTLGVGNYLMPPLGNCLTLQAFSLGNYLIVDSGSSCGRFPVSLRRGVFQQPARLALPGLTIDSCLGAQETCPSADPIK